MSLNAIWLRTSNRLGSDVRVARFDRPATDTFAVGEDALITLRYAPADATA